MSDLNNSNLDPLTGAPGAHPVGTGLGAAGGAGAGAVAGALGGPVGMVVGGVVGAVAGGLAGKATAEVVNPTAEDAYWREAHTRETYYEPGRSYDQDYRPAYALGWSPVGSTSDNSFDAVEPQLRERWDHERGVSSLDWDQARAPVRASWERAYGTTADDYAAGTTTLPLAGEALGNEDVVDVLNNLLESCRDGEQGFRASAEHAATGDLQSLLSRRATDCAVSAAELEHVVRSYGAEPAEGGTVAGALHRGWVAIKAALSSNDDQAVLEECERGEDAMVARYRHALEKPLPASVRVLVQRQAQEAQRHHDEVKTLRNQYRGGV
ncbi:ferritin-like domain-containing protein [Simplicispira psychrophila]|uniref:ferritin-like domain-containing protein n=1 Tax=Simplicispira psychrophila TaxID=80882 RepID=UPI00047F491D|nr:PA2169 family four-helix-bundle protein [Simplicispira psychrophila]